MHAGRSEFAGLRNGDLRRAAQGRFDLLISTDLHFARKSSLAPTASFGIVVIRVIPNDWDLVLAAFEAFAAAVDLTTLVGKLAVVWRDRWEIRPPPPAAK